MIATAAVPSTPGTVYRSFLGALIDRGFLGEIEATHGAKIVFSTDNSIYQRLPQAVIFPRNSLDLEIAARLVDSPEFRQVTLAPRGGGTGTNGQSLTEGVVVDLSRHMNRILEINEIEGWARVEGGVVKDQLNAAVKDLGLFFAPELSTSNRATIGGMVSTDASGQGSCRYGKTRDHVLELEVVLLGGQRLIARAMHESELEVAAARSGRLGEVVRCARDAFDQNRELIKQTFPPLNRCLTGYDLAHLRDEAGRLNMASIVCGSEGTLGFVTQARINLLKIPQHVALVNIRYATFMDALRDAQALMALAPLSIETVDSNVLAMAKADVVWHSISEFFPDDPEGAQALGINLVEISGDTGEDVASQIAQFERFLSGDAAAHRVGHTVAHGHNNVERVYAMRKRAVGLLGNTPGAKRPQPFVEDTAVPPEKLADYIAEFRDLLDSYGLRYGMFGHVDAGVLHVRPALDLRDRSQAAMVRPISDAVVALTHKYGGLLWGEHGKGVRSEYAPSLFGAVYPLLQTIKAAFDPYNQLNPGKIATPSNSAATLLKIDGVPLRADLDRQISSDVWDSFGAAMHCNGNGACFNHDFNDAMCPSWKATRKREQSPKGRASLFREWVRLEQQVDIAQHAGGAVARLVSRLNMGMFLPSKSVQANLNDAFSHEVYDAMAGCLACKSCSTQCPVKVDVPQFRARFLQLYHRRYGRPLRDYVVGSLEYVLPAAARIPGLYNRVIGSAIGRKALARYAGLVDSPTIDHIDFNALKRRYGVVDANPAKLAALSPGQRRACVVFVQDAFTRYFDPAVVTASFKIASLLGMRIYLAKFLPNGKPLQVHGFLNAFDAAARRNVAALQPIEKLGIPLVGIDPAMTLVYRQEYLKVPALAQGVPVVALLQEWLEKRLSLAAEGRQVDHTRPVRYQLMAHCTEKTTVAESTSMWVSVFRMLGLDLVPVATGCCGMSGTYGHETRNAATSKIIFEQSWQGHLDSEKQGELLATGYSCRSQVKRFASMRLRHPIEVLAERLEEMHRGQDFLNAQ